MTKLRVTITKTLYQASDEHKESMVSLIYIVDNIYCLQVVIFVCMCCGLGPGVFDPRQIVCYVWLDSHNYNHYVV